jgi:hypothetical protein
LADYAICTEATNMCRDNVGTFINCPGVHLSQECKLRTDRIIRGTILCIWWPWRI